MLSVSHNPIKLIVLMIGTLQEVEGNAPSKSSGIKHAVNFLTKVCANILNNIDDDVELKQLLTDNTPQGKDALFLMVKYNII